MRKIIVIGTMHRMMPQAEAEFATLLEQYSPQQLLVEIDNDDLQRNQINDYPKEMIFAVKWAKERGLPVLGFDCKINTSRVGIDPDFEEQVIERQLKVLGNRSWIELNVSSVNRELEQVDGFDSLVDKDAVILRHKVILENARQRAATEGVIVLLTGCANLDVFDGQLEDSVLPLRYSNF